MAREHHRSENAAPVAEYAVTRPDTPFPRHWLYYLLLKILILALAAGLATKYFGLW
jgi:hypothetical protein